MTDNHVLIIAEAGVNHNGNINIAKELAFKAKECGADIVKYQTFKSESVVSKLASKAEYQKNATGCEESQLDMVKKLELSYEEFTELKAYCDEIGIEFLSTAFDTESVEFLDKIIGQRIFKIPSGEVTNLPLLIDIAKTGKEIIMSTGMCTLEEINETLNILERNGCGKVSILHCTTEYPAPYEDINLNVIDTLKEVFPKCNIGYSDHTKGIFVPSLAVAKGATIIEKHFTLDNNMEGPDHKASLEPEELRRMIGDIRLAEKILGDYEKKVVKSELNNIKVARKSIVARTKIEKGALLTAENITTKRPGTGLSPMKWNQVIGTYAIDDFDEDEEIRI